MLPYCVYVLLSEKDKLLYIGYTTNIERRLQEHNNGSTISTEPRRPLILIYCEYHLEKEDAQRREMYFKTTAGKKSLKLMLRQSLAKLNYKGQQVV
ncbi:MAG: GIY-YIG nuclease family protein [Bacteroidia bacterium]|nr:GIY-YIG nuclease family protein [Bacteroidia bacterium]